MVGPAQNRNSGVMSCKQRRSCGDTLHDDDDDDDMLHMVEKKSGAVYTHSIGSLESSRSLQSYD